MYLRLASICLSLTLIFFAAPAFSHPGYTNIFHNHSSIEYLLALCVIVGIIYRNFKS